jgi:hypothetical protein
MKAKMLEQFQFTDELKERLVLMVVFQNQSPKELAKKYDTNCKVKPVRHLL